MARNDLRARNILLTARWLAAYAAEGHPLTLETRCGEAPEDNEIVFRIADWPAFSRVMDETRPGPNAAKKDTAHCAN